MESMDENRRCRRRRVLKEGKIVLNAGWSLVNCAVRDQSQIGAKIRVPSPTVLPNTFGLLCVTEGMIYPARTVWRCGDDLGVAFFDRPKRAPPRKW
jgi:hypothetical protein